MYLIRTVQALFQILALKGAKFSYSPKKLGQKLMQLQENAGNADFATFKTQFHNILGQNLKKSLDSSIFLHPLWLLKL